MAKAGSLSYHREAVRVRVKKCITGQSTADRKFSVDPQITSYEVLHTIIGKAFDIRSDFSLSYRAIDDYGQETFLPLLSDWDLDAAIMSASDPYLSINIEAKSMTEKQWQSEEALPTLARDVFGTIEIPRLRNADTKPPIRLPGMLKNKMEQTFNIFQRAFNLGEEAQATPVTPLRPPLTDSEFRKYLDRIGQISKTKELRSAIYYGGVESSLRKVVWKHILNVYPQGMSGKERMDYMKKKTQEYEALKETWLNILKQGGQNEELSFVTGMVRKDVLRTDRHHKFYAGSDDNQNIAALFNVLTTYALNHPSVSYCQGMSDLASPLLVTMGDEAHAYICFCALMGRLKPNFMLDGAQMTLKFQHLTEGLMQCDPQFYAYLKYHQAEDLLFCYRWLLLEMKREFAFDDALHMLEVLWSSIEGSPPEAELPLCEIKFTPDAHSPPISPLVRISRETPYSKLCAIRRQSSSISLTSLTSARRHKMRENQSLDETTLAKHNRLRKQGRLKPFLSLDDNCMEMHEGVSPNHIAKSLEPDPLTLMKKKIHSMKLANKHNSLSSSTGNLSETKKKSPVGEKSSCSLNKLQLEKENEDIRRTHNKKTVKNLNEFLNLAGKGRGWRSQCSSISESDAIHSSNAQITRSQGTMLEASSDLDSECSLKHASSYSSSISPNVFDPPASDEDISPDCPPPSVQNDSSPDDSAEYCPVTTSITRELTLEMEHLDRQVLGATKSKTEPEIFVWENPLKLPTPDEQIELEMDGKDQDCTFTNIAEETPDVPNFLARSALTTSNIIHSIKSGLRSPAQVFVSLPSPQEFGGGNPFLMFLCLTLLRQHRDYIMQNQMDYNEMAMHFDKMVRRHNVERVLEEARQMFATYLKQQSFQAAQHSKSSYKV